MKLMTARQCAELIGKSERSVSRYIELIEAKGGLIVHRMPGLLRRSSTTSRCRRLH